jgi:hypothetical protein
LNPGTAVIGGLIYEDVYNNGGSWLMAGTVDFGSGCSAHNFIGEWHKIFEI